MDEQTEQLINPVASSIQSGDTHEKEEKDEDLKKKLSLWTKIRRNVVIEPFLVISMISGFPAYPIHEQYFYYAVGLSMGINTNNLTSSLNESCGTEPNDTAYQHRELVQARSAELSMYIQLAIFLPTTISMLLYGTYSDKIGRKLLFILPTIGSIIDAVLHMFIIYFQLPLFMFYITQIGSVFFGSFMLVFIACYAYIADTVPPHKRAIRMIIIDCILRLLGGFVQLGIGYWIRESYFWPYCFVIGGKIIALLYAIFLIPETVQKSPTQKFHPRDIANAFKLFIKDDETKRRWKINLLSLSLLVEMIFLAEGIFTLFEMNTPLCWNSVMIGYYGAASDTIRAFGVVGAVFKKYFEDHWLALIGKISFMFEMLYLAFVQTTWMMYLVPVISIFGVMSMPVLRTMMSNLVSEKEQGALFSALHVLISLVSLFSGTMTKKIYALTLNWWDGFVFLLSAFGVLLAALLLILYIYLLKRERRKNPTYSNIQEEYT